MPRRARPKHAPSPTRPGRPAAVRQPPVRPGKEWIPAGAERAFSWFPGHMLKAQQRLGDEINQADLVLELRDARLPLRSANPALALLAGTRPCLVVLNKASLADPSASEAWHATLASQRLPHLFVDADSRQGLALLLTQIAALTRPGQDRLRARAIRPPPPRVVIVGLPNVGKSTLINRLAKGQRAKTAPMPGVTRHLTWIAVGDEFLLLDSPGIMLPRIANERDALALTWIGAIKDTILGPQRVTEALLTHLLAHPVNLPAHTWWPPDWRSRTVTQLMQHVARQRGFLAAGGSVNLPKTAQFVLEQYRMGHFGRITFDDPPPS
jgi:ribosome biogenesis GTPase A